MLQTSKILQTNQKFIEALTLSITHVSELNNLINLPGEKGQVDELLLETTRRLGDLKQAVESYLPTTNGYELFDETDLAVAKHYFDNLTLQVNEAYSKIDGIFTVSSHKTFYNASVRMKSIVQDYYSLVKTTRETVLPTNSGYDEPGDTTYPENENPTVKSASIGGLTTSTLLMYVGIGSVVLFIAILLIKKLKR